jgi:hypothetical protein
MKYTKCLARWPVGLFVAALAPFLFAGCKSTSSTSCCDNMQATAMVAPAAVVPAAPPAPVTVAPPVIAPAPVPAPAPMTMPVRINAGLSTPLTNSDGTVWLPDQNFVDGETVERPDVQIANTTEPEIYRSERYSMTSFSYPVPNGKYTVKLHFCETFEGITGPGQRIFSFNVEGHEFKDFDVFVKAGGALRAYIETVNVEITDGKLDITFTPNVENPQINGIEILPNP